MLPYLSLASQPSLLHMDGFHYCYCEEVCWNLSFFSCISVWFCLDREQGQLHVPEGGAHTRAREKAHKRAWPAPELCACFLHRDSCLVRCSLPGGERQVTPTIQPRLVSNWGRTLEHLSPLVGLCPHKWPLLLCEKKKKPRLPTCFSPGDYRKKCSRVLLTSTTVSSAQSMVKS